jgi:hypothetical protein
MGHYRPDIPADSYFLDDLSFAAGSKSRFRISPKAPLSRQARDPSQKKRIPSRNSRTPGKIAVEITAMPNPILANEAKKATTAQSLSTNLPSNLSKFFTGREVPIFYLMLNGWGNAPCGDHIMIDFAESMFS